MADNKTPYLQYKGRPLVRQGNMLYYGSMADSCVVMIQILTTKKVGELTVAEKVQVQLAYAIGVAEPVSVCVDSFGTGKISDEEMTALLRKTCDLTPAGIIRKLHLRRPIFGKTAMEGHFGVEDLPWEETDLAEELKTISAKFRQ